MKVKLNSAEKFFSAISPKWGMDRLKFKAYDSYYGASTTRRQTSQWQVGNKDADSDILKDLPYLRNRSRDLVRNNPLATGAINTNVTSVVGDGFKMRSTLDREVLNMTDDQINALENTIEREWGLFANSLDCSVNRGMNFDSILNLIYRSCLENGDVFITTPRVSRKSQPYSLRLQVIEADRVSNPEKKIDNEKQRGGITFDATGAPTVYSISKTHPGSSYSKDKNNWISIPAFNRNTGLRNIIHLFDQKRPGQSRGVPYLAPVIESLKMLGRYTEAEIMAAVISGMFTVFIESESNDFLGNMQPTDEIGGASSDDDYKIGPGAMVGLAPGEKISSADPGRPNTAFDPFVQAILRQVGVALELPYEILIKHFTASYSAARAALLEAWKMFKTRRKFLVDNFCNIVFEIFMYEAVAKGRVNAPGFFTDPILKQAYLSNEWIGSAPGQLDPLKEINAAEKRLGLSLTSRTYEAAQLNGSNWEKTIKQIEKEKAIMPEPETVEEPKGAVGIDENMDEEDTDLETN